MPEPRMHRIVSRTSGDGITLDDNRTLLTVGQAAIALERSTEQVRRYLREGRLTGQRMGGQWFINQQDLQQFTRSAREKSSFLARVGAARTIRPLDSVIGIAQGRKTDISRGKREFLKAASRGSS
ncbi:hypothetical protein BH23CHL3_BH23CHL3_08720 [soil metagenome]|jgi:excisionase family DNA binding protein